MSTIFDFPEALSRLRGGRRVQRIRWDGMWLYIEREEMRVDGQPPIYLHHEENGAAPWGVTQSDVLAEDWQEVAE